MAFGARGKFKGKGKGPKRDNKQNALFKRKRFCRFTVEKVDQIDYKDVDVIMVEKDGETVTKYPLEIRKY